MDTCANESFNNTIAWLAPKNKVLCGTSSLDNRICIAVGISTLGTFTYFNRLFGKMGITVTEDVRHYLRIKGDNRQKRIDKTKTRDFKLKRKSAEFEKIKLESKEAASSRAKREGVYQPGIGMTGGYDQADLAGDNEDGAKKPAAKPSTNRKKTKKKKKNPEGRLCNACGSDNHLRSTNKLCRFYVGRSQTTVTAAAAKAKDNTETLEMEEELAKLESLPLPDADESDDGFFSATSEFS